MLTNEKPIFKRILLKLSGEALQGQQSFGIDINILNRIAKEIKEILNLGIQIGIVIGGGNFFRGKELRKLNLTNVISDSIGMLSTIINSLALYDILCNLNIKTSILSSIPLKGICNNYNWVKAIELLNNNNIVIFAAGLGIPFLTTDTAACLRGIEMNADILLKATKVDGVFSEDPMLNNNSILYSHLSYQDVLINKFKVMDLVAFILAKENKLPICIFNINKPGILKQIIMGNKKGTLIN